jgi:hypothetical protein
MKAFSRTALLALLALLPVGCAPPDPIEKLAADLSRSQAADGAMIFPSGPFQHISLSPTTPIAEVVAQAFKYSFRDDAVGTNFTVLATRQVRICGREELARLGDVYYTAVLVRTAVGQRIVLLQFRPGGYWWNKVYETP